MDDVGARVAALRGVGGAAARVVSIHYAIRDDMIFLLLDLDETHLGYCIRCSSDREVVGGWALKMRSDCDSRADHCGVRSGMGRGGSRIESWCAAPFNATMLGTDVFAAKRAAADDGKDTEGRKMLGGREPSHISSRAAPMSNSSCSALELEHVGGDDVARLTRVGRRAV